MVKVRPSATELVQKQDVTQKDKLMSAEAVINLLRKVAENKSTKAAEGRRQKKKDSGEAPKKRRVEHPAGMVQDDDETPRRKVEASHRLTKSLPKF